MIAYMDDPYPGRCRNLHPGTDRYGYAKNYRCLDRSGHTGTCRFPEPDPPAPTTWSGNIYIKQSPTKWVPPWERYPE